MDALLHLTSESALYILIQMCRPKSANLLPLVQAWYAVHAPLLRMVAAQQAVWGRVVSDTTPLASGETSSANLSSPTEVDGETSQRETLDALIRDVGRSYRLKCEQVSR